MKNTEELAPATKKTKVAKTETENSFLEERAALNKQAISEIMRRERKLYMRQKNPVKTSPKDMDGVRKICEKYLDECAELGCTPDVRGLACMMGMTREGLYYYAEHHPGGEFDRFLHDFSDLCAKVVMEAAMSGAYRDAPAIFTAKARYGWRDNINIQVEKAEGPLGPTVSAEEIMKKYELIED